MFTEYCNFRRLSYRCKLSLRLQKIARQNQVPYLYRIHERFPEANFCFQHVERDIGQSSPATVFAPHKLVFGVKRNKALSI